MVPSFAEKIESRRPKNDDFRICAIECADKMRLNEQLNIQKPTCYKLNSHDCFSFTRRGFDSLSFSFSFFVSFSLALWLSLPLARISQSTFTPNVYRFSTVYTSILYYVFYKFIEIILFWACSSFSRSVSHCEIIAFLRWEREKKLNEI